MLLCLFYPKTNIALRPFRKKESLRKTNGLTIQYDPYSFMSDHILLFLVTFHDYILISC